MRHFVLLLAFAAAPALAGPIQAGQWEITTRITDMQSADMPPAVAAMMKGRPITARHCVTPAEAAEGPGEMMKRTKNCRLTSYSAVGSRFSAATSCDFGKGGRMTGTSSGTFTPTSFAVTSRSVMTGGMSSTTAAQVTGRRIGDCR